MVTSKAAARSTTHALPRRANEARLDPHPAESVRTAVEALFQLEHGRTLQDMHRIVRALIAMLDDPEQAQLSHTWR
ncbi:MAG: hypothetical protein LBU43_08660 [Candidatus Accumulibacter sp.]|jgi:hypothetical protein|nr:hypothetical protein [Accumulibacter sp.]